MNKEFYEDEVIEGFYVPAMLKKAWGAQLDVLNETDIICRRHDIPYFADWGTLLAAIRHGGYIPWDDDLDISMRRSDYERFLRYAKDELPEGFKVMTFRNTPGHHFFVARIVGKPRICFEEDHLTRFHGFPYIAGIDLFVLDNVCRDREKERLKAKKAEFVLTVADEIADGKVKGSKVKKLLDECESYTGRRINRSLSGEELRIMMYGLVEELFASVPDEEADALVQMMPYGLYEKQLYIPKEYYEKTVRLPYESTTISVPLCYDAVMRRKFGNYMQIRKKWAGHDYPFFYGQHEDLLKVLDFEYPAYKASRKDVLASKRPSPVKASDEPEDIVFIPFAPKYWKYMDKMYRHYAGDDNCRVWVVPVPYYYKAWDGSMSEEVFDTDAYPEDLYLQDYSQVDLQGFHPAKIVIQNPFDGWNSVYSVPPAYYSSNLKSYTDELIYLPFFVTDDFDRELGREYINMDHYVCMPGVMNCNTIILPSQILKDTYIEKITEFTHTEGDEEVKAHLDGKIKVLPEFIYCGDDSFGTKERSYGKKTIVFFTTISILAERGPDATDKIKRAVEVFAQNSDGIDVIWISQCCKEELELIERSVADDFREAVKDFLNSCKGTYIDDLAASEYDRYAGMCDAYYGNPSSLALKFYYLKKPVMIINIDC
ncbi:MAG: LicD family protein [Lachnospiraceae bacterium]|nr:LicD family protein [Lachnospiraceae bacterium]